MTRTRNRSVIEALLFASSRPLTLENLAEITGLVKPGVRELLEELRSEYESRGGGFGLIEVAGGYQLRTLPEFSEEVAKLFTVKSRRRFSRSSLETLSIIAYRQPVTRAEIEHIRGVDCGGVLKNLLTQAMVRVLGRKEAPGRPILYGTTREFLEYFGLRDIESLPTLEEVTELLEEGEGEHDAATERLRDKTDGGLPETETEGHDE